MLHKDDWLSTFFPQGAYVCRPPYGEDIPVAGFVAAKIPSNDVHSLNALLKNGFVFIETLLHFKQDKPMNASTTSCSIRGTKLEDEGDVVELASRAFTQSRFFKDENISSTLASDIKREWVANFFRGKRGDKMLVACVNDKPVAFILLIGNTIDLIAVHPDHYRKGIAAGLIAAANSELGPLNAGTQMDNQASIALYQKSGFFLHGASYVLHRHG